MGLARYRHQFCSISLDVFPVRSIFRAGHNGLCGFGIAVRASRAPRQKKTSGFSDPACAGRGLRMESHALTCSGFQDLPVDVDVYMGDGGFAAAGFTVE